LGQTKAAECVIGFRALPPNQEAVARDGEYISISDPIFQIDPATDRLIFNRQDEAADTVLIR
jgi:hypothetical protein